MQNELAIFKLNFKGKNITSERLNKNIKKVLQTKSTEIISDQTKKKKVKEKKKGKG